MTSFSSLVLKVSVVAGVLSAVTSLSGAEMAHAGLSASRAAGIPAEFYMREARKASLARGHLTDDNSVLEEKGDFSKAAWDRVPEIQATDLQTSFELAREERFFIDSESRPRRATWLYPDDGCFVRAVVAANMIEKSFGIKAAKIFAFDNLTVKTENSPSGEVSWWYHVAAITKVVDPTTKKETFYVYDPAISPRAPMEVRQWLQAMHAPNAEIAVCAGETYDPQSDCTAGSTTALGRAKNEGQWYLSSEWYRLEDLGRDPVRELGDNPPWL